MSQPLPYSLHSTWASKATERVRGSQAMPLRGRAEWLDPGEGSLRAERSCTKEGQEESGRGAQQGPCA